MEKKATGNSSSFKNFDKTFNFKAHFTCDSSNLVYVGKNTPVKLEFVKQRPRLSLSQHIRQSE